MNCRCKCGLSAEDDFKFVLHDALDSSGIDTVGFCSQIKDVSDIERGTSIAINRGVDLARAALHIAAEDDSLISHSSVPLPNDNYTSVSMLSLIYSEILQILRMFGVLNFDVEIFFPRDSHSSPRGYLKQKIKEPDQSHIMTSQSLLVEILKDLKNAFWPFQLDHARSSFLRAAEATGANNANEG
ncbi:hypothetical protein SASPL_156117 [Salvia splendens]|uniref:Uncharacterized protein n=1 Tax=Salvia splendens TaxID=180675 RepID=A0A8X8YWD5_SALSN|nr:hypothetical protein SASPL_156117 [Salvia splendens]